MLDKFQQSMLEKLEVPRILFLNRLVVVPVGLRWCCTVHTVHRTVEFRRSSSLVWFDVTVVVQQQVPWLTLLAHAWLDSGYIFCVFTWVRYGRISQNS